MRNKSVCILDYGSGNVKSVFNIFKFLGFKVSVSNEKESIINSSHLVLPGVGAFGSSMEKILNRIPIDILENEVINKGKPFLGICLGMQILADKGTEFGEFNGLGWIPGSVNQLDSKGLPLPHMGWNEVNSLDNHVLFRGLNDIKDFYFVHSYAFQVVNELDVAAKTDYGTIFTSAVQKNNIHGVQFHPEKSQKAGQVVLMNFMDIV